MEHNAPVPIHIGAALAGAGQGIANVSLGLYGYTAGNLVDAGQGLGVAVGLYSSSDIIRQGALGQYLDIAQDPDAPWQLKIPVAGGVAMHTGELANRISENPTDPVLYLEAVQDASAWASLALGGVTAVRSVPRATPAESAAAGEGTATQYVAPQNATKVTIEPGIQSSFTSADLGNAILNDPVAARAYCTLQEQGIDVTLYRSADGVAGTAGSGSVRINLEYNPSATDAVSSIIHEAKHISLEANTGNLYGLRGTQAGEYSARALEFFYQTGRRPNAIERGVIQQQIRDLGY